jgi:hypothetical protein
MESFPFAGLALFAADASVPWKPQALAFALWHNFSRSYEERLSLSMTGGDPLSPISALAGRRHHQSAAAAAAAAAAAVGDGRSVGLLLANPTNRSVEIELMVTGPLAATVVGGRTVAQQQQLCSASSPCEVRQIVDTSGKVHSTRRAENRTLVLDAWGVAMVASLSLAR